MEVQINKEIRNYTESIFFGLSLRQCVCSVAAIAVSAVSYILLSPILGTETASWICILGASPFAALGFVKYHGMTAEKLLLAWLRSEMIEPRKLGFSANNIYYEAVKDALSEHVKEGKNKHEYI